MLHFIRFLLILAYIAAFAVPTAAQDGSCRNAAAEAADLLTQARAALADADVEHADALIAAAHGLLAEGCPTVDDAAAQPEPTTESAPAATPAAPAANFTVNPPQVNADQSIFFVRIAHTGIDSGPLDFYVNSLGGVPLVQNISFGELTGLITMPTGSHTVHVRPAGSGADADALSTLQWDFVGNSTWVVTSAGLLETLAFITEPVNVIRTRLDGKARIRVVNWVSGGERLTVTSDQGVSFGDGLGWIGIKDLEIDPGTHNLQIVGELGNPFTEPVAFTFAPDMVYTVLLVGGKDGNPPPQFMGMETPQDQTRVRFVNERGDAVDIHTRPGNALLAGNLAPGASTDFFALPSGATAFVAYAPGTGPTGQEKAALSEQLRPGRDLTVTLRGNGQMAVTESTLTP